MIENQGEQTPEGSSPVPASPALWQPGVQRQMAQETAKTWLERRDRARDKAKDYHPQWDDALKRYAEPKPEKSTDINALHDYRHVESKKAALFHSTPTVNLVPKGALANPTLPVDALLNLREAVLNHELGPDGADAQQALHKTLIDALAASGFLAVEVGYEQVTVPVPPDPMTGAPPPVAEIPVWARRFVSPISGKRLLVPADFYDTTFDEAPWLGVQGSIPLSQAQRMKWVFPTDFKPGKVADEFRYGSDKAEESTDDTVTYAKVWYRAALFDAEVVNPDLYRCVVFVDGVDAPVAFMDSPYQRLTPEGALTDDSMRGNPIHVGTLRDIPDSAYVPSDLVIGAQLTKELNNFRTDLVTNRKSRRPLVLMSDRSLSPELIGKIEKNKGPIVVPSEVIEGVDPVKVYSVGSEPRDNFTAQNYIERDREMALGASANQSGNFSDTKRTATEVRTVQGNASARADTEKQRIRKYFAALVRKFDAILQLTVTQAELLKILGPLGAQLYEQWRTLPGTYLYTIQPDAGTYRDPESYRAQKLAEYNLLRKDPLINATELVKGVVEALGYDAGKVVGQQQEQKPDAPKLSFSVASMDVVTQPAIAGLLLAILEQSGYKVPPDVARLLAEHATANGAMQGGPVDVTGAPMAHPGAADRTEPLNQHAQDRTGGVQGVM